ncbi:MAG TPA: alpha-glucan family phosphorylase, partial [Gemmatimonadaceae bacterium]|nr:alpha-glucan family phosphorylase [Gemmatimonadaceae bacterium]
WDSPNVDALWEEACGKERWRGELGDMGEGIRRVPDEQLWAARTRDRQRLVTVVRSRLARQLGFRGADASAIERAAHAFDANTLTLGFARRFVEYKRPNLLLRDPARLERLLTNAARPVQIVVAGKAHPDDPVGAALIAEWVAFAARPQIRDSVVFLEDYDITLAEEMVRGVDVWVNTPRPPWEACGTSGMKVLANGGLNASTLDGWWAEAYRPDVGWSIASGEIDAASATADDADAARLYDLLEREIVPAFYERDTLGVPRRWLERIRTSMAVLAPQFSANRMMREYVRDIYAPAAELYRRRACGGATLGRDLAAWSGRLGRDWRSIHFGRVEVSEANGTRVISVPVYLGSIAPEEVAVELYADSVGGEGSQCLTMTRAADLPGAVHGVLYRVNVPGDRPMSDYTPRVIARHPDARVPMEAAFITWYR